MNRTRPFYSSFILHPFANRLTITEMPKPDAQGEVTIGSVTVRRARALACASGLGDRQSRNRLTITEMFWPPKPKLFERT